MGRRSFMRILKFGVHQGCLKVIHVPFGTACALVNRTDGDFGEISAEMLRREAAELSSLDTSQPAPMPEQLGRRYVREAAVVYLQRPFDVKEYMNEAHINRGSRPDSIGNLADSTGDAYVTLDDSVQIVGDDDGILASDDTETYACAPYCKLYSSVPPPSTVRSLFLFIFLLLRIPDSPTVNGEESFCVQICRLLCEMEEKPNSQLAALFNTSHKLVSRYTDALAGLGKLLTSKVSTGTSFSLV